ncbi:MAG: histidinol-phosphatase HisJ family protein [Clostridia bacterium]|nr:histidinol-phosphatase HisJ family protein [Clostridia bacterium]
MVYKQNLHTHSVFCDGKDTPEEMVLKCLERNFNSVGFSIHSFVPYSKTVVIPLERIKQYKAEIRRLKEKYKGIIDIYLGIEYDFYSEGFEDGYEYTIGSVHYLNTKNGIQGFDNNLQSTLNYIDAHFDGDSLSFAKAYYETVASLPTIQKFDIIGHFDVLTKNNELKRFLDTDDEKYLGFAKDAILALKGKIDIFEVNTGAISRGYRTSPYPSKALLKEFLVNGFKPVISSDCHDKNFVDCYFDESAKLLKEVGFKSQCALINGKFEEISL